MFRHALRRLLWTIPTLIGVSLVTFLFLSYVPDPTDDPATDLAPAERVRLRRERFLDLPRFLNTSPEDVRVRAMLAVRAIVEGGPEEAAGRVELSRLGGAALPHVLPSLDALAPEPRARVALALAPVGLRMGFSSEGLEDPARAVAFWTRFWDDRGIEFRRSSVRSAVRRIARHGGASRAAELYELDTFVLEDVLADLPHPVDKRSFELARALLDIAAHVTGREDRIAPGDDLVTAAACAERWRSFWMVYRNDFVTFDAPSRLAAVLIETRYAKWAFGAMTRRLGMGEGGVAVLDAIEQRAPVTLTLVFGAIALAYAAAIPLGLLGAASRGRRRDMVTATVVLVLYAIPTAVLARLASPIAGKGLVVPTLVLSLGLLAAPARQTRAALASALAQEHVRAAMARGASRTRALVKHALPFALLPVATLATLEAPMALGGAFVVERVFGLPGLGAATIAAVQTRDTSWLMAVSIFTAALAALGVLISDLCYVVIDRRLARGVLGKARG
jgi:ABC-type dipeptide/oligopeptide/nickel transport system permease component